MAYKIVYKISAEKSFAKLSKEVQLRIFQAVQRLANDPRPPGVKKLQSAFDLYRIRIGDYRIIYTINDQQLKILIVTIGHRSDVYNA